MSDDLTFRINLKKTKQGGLYEIENIDNPNILIITINPKEYFEKYKDYSINTKHKGVKKNTPSMNFEAYSKRLATLREYYFPKKNKKIEQKRFQIVNESMKMKSVRKTQFAGLNDKRYYLHDGIVSLPFGHFRKEKEKYRTKLHTEVKKEMYKFLELEGKAVHLCKRLRILRSILVQAPMLYQLDHSVIVNFFAFKNTRELIINGSWK